MKILADYIKRHKFIYFTICIAFLLGLIIGSIFLLKIQNIDRVELKKYIEDIVVLSEQNGIDRLSVFKKSIIDNVKFSFVLYLLGCTIIAGFTVYIAIFYKGIILGYTISSIMISFGLQESIKYLFPIIILHNVVFLPIVFLLAMSGIVLHKEIMKRNYNFKMIILRHTWILLVSLVFCVISSGIEAYFSTMIFEIL